MFINNLHESIFTSFLVFTIISTFSLPVLAQEEITTFDIQGTNQEDSKTLNDMINFLESVIDKEQTLFASISTYSDDDVLSEADLEVNEIIKQRLENEKDEPKEMSNLSDSYSDDIDSIDKENIKKIYVPDISTFKDLKKNAKLETLVNSKDFIWYIPCETASHEYASISMKENGTNVDSLAYEERQYMLSNEDIINILNEKIKNQEDIESVQYTLLPLVHLNLAYVVTSTGNEYIIPISSEGEDIGLKKGVTYNKNEFIDLLGNYELPVSTISDAEEIINGTESPFKNQVLLFTAIIGMLLSP